MIGFALLHKTNRGELFAAINAALCGQRYCQRLSASHFDADVYIDGSVQRWDDGDTVRVRLLIKKQDGCRSDVKYAWSRDYKKQQANAEIARNAADTFADIIIGAVVISAGCWAGTRAR